MNRREYLGTIGIGGLSSISGCLNDITRELIDHRHADNPWSNQRSEKSLISEIVQVDVDLPSGTYALWSFDLERTVEFTYAFENITNNVLEAYVIERDESDRFRDANEFLHFSNFYDSGVNLFASNQISQGRYYFAIVNSDVGLVVPEGRVVGELSLGVR